MLQPIGSDLSIIDLPASPAGARALALMLLDQMLDLQERLGVISIDDRLKSGARIRSDAEKWSEMAAEEYVARDIERLQRELDGQSTHAVSLPDRSKPD